MTAIPDQDIERMIRVIIDVANPEQIILFGSQGRGESRQGSDIDLLIVESDAFGRKRSRRKEMARLWRSLASIRVAKDILVYSRDEVEYWRHSLNSVVAKALREGKVFYERP